MSFRSLRFTVLPALALLLTACPEPPKPAEKPTPPLDEEPPPTKPVTEAPKKKEPEKLKSGTHATIAERKNNNDSWDRGMVVAGGKLFVMTNVNSWKGGTMYVPAARLWSTPVNGGELGKLMDLEGYAALAADDTSLYVAVNRDLALTGTPKQNTPSGRIFKMPLAGGAPTDLAKGIEPRVIGIDGDTLWFDGMKMPKDGSKPPSPSGVKSPMTIAFDAEYVYFTQGKGGSGEPTKADGKNGRVLRMKKSGGAPTVLAKDLPDEPGGLALDGTHVYVSAVAWSSPAFEKAGVIARVPKEGGSLEVLAKDQPSVRGAWLGGDHVYVLSGRGGRPCNVLKVPKAGGAVETAISDSTLEHATADDTSIYFSSDGTFKDQGAGGDRLSNPILVRYVR